MTLPILTSKKLTELLNKRAALSAKAKTSQSEVRRLNKLFHTGWLDETVVRVTDVDAPTATFIGIRPRPDQASVVTIGTGETDEATRRNDSLAKTLAGESLTSAPSIDEQLAKEQKQWSAYETAIEFLNREIEREHDVLAVQYAKTLKPKHDQLMTAMCSKLEAAHAAWSDMYSMKRELIDGGIGLRGLCLVLPESFLGTPSDPYSELANFFTAAKNAAFIKEIPQSLRMKVAK